MAAGPAGAVNLVPVILVLVAAFCWAWTNILIRLISRKESSLSLMLASNSVVILVCGVTLPFVWVTPDVNSVLLLVLLGAVGASGQFLMFEGYRLAPASALAPFEYITLIWSFLWGFLIWGDWPPTAVFTGAGLIIFSGLALIMVEGFKSRRLQRA